MSKAEKEHLSRVMSPAKLAEYASRGNWTPFRHLVHISNILVRAATSSEQTFDSIQVSVRHGKSELVTKWFVVWYLMLFPDRNVLIVSYSEDFSRKWGRLTRDLYAEWAPQLVGEGVREDASSATEWLTTAGGGLRAVGMGGAITGLGFHLIVIDDPIKNIEAALSEAANKSMREWYDTTLRTRLMPGGTMVLTMARWTDYDLAAYVTGEIETETVNDYPDPWVVTKLPAVAEAPKGAGEDWRDELGRADGEALWPEVWPVERLQPLMALSGWDALYQQNPVPRGGGMFAKDDWVKRVAPADAIGWRCCRYWDTAATKGKGDWTVGALLGIDPQGLPWILDIVRERVDAGGVEELLKRTAERDGRTVPIRYEQAKAAAGKATTHSYAKALIGYDFQGVPVEGDKTTRAALLASAQQNRLVHIADAGWAEALIEEFARFPKGRHDDQVDACSGAFAFLTQGGPSTITAPSSVIVGDPIEFIKARARDRGQRV